MILLRFVSDRLLVFIHFIVYLSISWALPISADPGKLNMQDVVLTRGELSVVELSSLDIHTLIRPLDISVEKKHITDNRELTEDIAQDNKHKVNTLNIKMLIEQEYALIYEPFTCSVEPMFSSEKQSWYFESFVLQGLFSVIGNYQNTHPRAIHINSGRASLDQLLECVGDFHFLEKIADVYFLKSPLIINSGAALTVDKQTLRLQPGTGALVINLGVLKIDKSTVSSSTGVQKYDDKNVSGVSHRGFVATWAKGSLLMENSRIYDLGMTGKFMNGISLSKNKHQDFDTQRARAYIHSTVFDGVYAGIYLRDANLQMFDSIFHNTGGSIVNVSDSFIRFENNKLYGNMLGPGIRLAGNTVGIVKANIVNGMSGSGVQIGQFSGNLKVSKSQFTNNMKNGISIKSTSQSPLKGKILLKDNIISNNVLSGVRALGAYELVLYQNSIKKNGSYGVKITSNYSGENSGKMVLIKNSLMLNRISPLNFSRVESLFLGHNTFQMSGFNQSIFSGDLALIQSKILHHTLLNSEVVEYRHVSL